MYIQCNDELECFQAIQRNDDNLPPFVQGSMICMFSLSTITEHAFVNIMHTDMTHTPSMWLYVSSWHVYETPSEDHGGKWSPPDEQFSLNSGPEHLQNGSHLNYCLDLALSTCRLVIELRNDPHPHTISKSTKSPI